MDIVISAAEIPQLAPLDKTIMADPTTFVDDGIEVEKREYKVHGLNEAKSMENIKNDTTDENKYEGKDNALATKIINFEPGELETEDKLYQTECNYATVNTTTNGTKKYVITQIVEEKVRTVNVIEDEVEGDDEPDAVQILETEDLVEPKATTNIVWEEEIKDENDIVENDLTTNVDAPKPNNLKSSVIEDDEEFQDDDNLENTKETTGPKTTTTENTTTENTTEAEATTSEPKTTKPGLEYDELDTLIDSTTNEDAAGNHLMNLKQQVPMKGEEKQKKGKKQI